MEFGLSLPAKYKVGKGESKHILREIARGFVPPELINRPKKGFGVPLARWLREDFQSLVHEVLLDERSRSRGWYRFEKLEEVLKKHQQGFALESIIWPVLMLELWVKNWID